MSQNDEMPDSLIIEGEDNSIDNGIEVLSRRSRRVLYIVVRDGRRVVLKGLTENLRAHTEERAALRKEYLLGLRADSESIARVYGFEQHPQLGPVIVMEYIDGMPLNVYLANSQVEGANGLKLSERRKIAFNIAESLAAIHKAGVAHRDLKPDNILITSKEGSARIIDFGNGDSEDFVIYKQSLGTERYGAPEQKEPAQGGMASDVYSFGKILDELLPEWRFKSLRKACEDENPSLRPDMEMVSRRLDPSRFFHRKITFGLTGMVIALMMAGAVWYGEKSAMADSKEAVGMKESVIADKLSERETAENTVTMEEPQNKSLPDSQIENGGEPEAVIPQIMTEEKTVVTTVVVQDTMEFDGILQKYIDAAEKIILRYGNLGYNEKTRVCKTEETLKRGEEQFKLSDEMEKELIAKGFNEAQRSKAYHSLWAYMIDENNKIDGNYELVKKLMQKQSEEKANTH